MQPPAHRHTSTLADEELLRQVGQGCGECFAVLYHRYCRLVFSIAYRILRDKAETEDILQDVFLSIYLLQERFDPARGSVRTWILQFAYFKALLRRRYLRIRHYYAQEETREGKQARTTPSFVLRGMSAAESIRCVEAGIAALTSRQRQVIELVHFEGYTLQEASEISRESLANTRNLYYRGLQALRGLLCAPAALKSAKESLILERNDVPCEQAPSQ